jgi:DNA-binding NarL/FixJ family response regulator
VVRISVPSSLLVKEKPMEKYRILLADDHILVRSGLARIVGDKPGLTVIGEADDGLHLLQLLKTTTPDLIILDISMPNLRGIEAIREIKTLSPKVKILILTMHKEREYLHQAISAGANGYLLKEDVHSELFNAIERVRGGKTYISPFFSDESSAEWVRMWRGKGKLPSLEPLTTREKEVLKLIAEGKSAKEVGDLLTISMRTVERHRANIMTKLNVKKTVELVKYAIQKGYI